MYGRAIEIGDPALRSAFREAIKTRIDWAPEGPRFHLFSVDIAWAAFVKFGDRQTMTVWHPQRRSRHNNPV